MYTIVCSENDIILGRLKDLLGVCEGIVWAITLQLTQVNLRINFGRRISCICVWFIVSVIMS